jgi:hypothetical protein
MNCGRSTSRQRVHKNTKMRLQIDALMLKHEDAACHLDPPSNCRSKTMRTNRISMTAFMTIACTAVALAADPPAEKAEAPEGKTVTLMGMLSEWMYPDAKFNGTESSDAAVSDVSSVKSKAVLTTPDSADKVLAFYCEKLKVDDAGKNLDEKPGERITTKRAISIQDDSDGRRLKVFIIAINEKDSSTTLVVSRSAGEDTTHIAWSNWRQIWP